MYKPVTFIIFFILIILRNSVFAQDELEIAENKDSKRNTKTYDILSLDGKVQKIHIMPDYANHILRISCLKDTIIDSDFWGVPVDAIILNKQFIEIKYAVRGGSAIGRGDIMVLCVNNGKLYEALHAEQLLTSENIDQLENYNIKIDALEGNDKSNYKLIVRVHDSVKSKSDPESNYNYNNKSVLHFDPTRNVFYSIKEDLYDVYINIYDKKTNKTHKQKIKGNFPTTILGNRTYYFINNDWYDFIQGKELYQYAPTVTK